MNFPYALYDGSDPLYAPCTSRTRDALYWRCPKPYLALGYKPARVRLAGTIGDGKDAERAHEARVLTVSMLDAYEQETYQSGTWGWLIHRYLTDAFSPFHEKKPNTQITYREPLEKWKAAVGLLPIGLSYEDIKTLQVGMKAKGRSDSYIKRMFTMLRIIAGYGKALRIPEARDTVDVLSEITFTSAPKRSSVPTHAHIRAIVDEADARGMFAFATGLLIQWTYILRAVDVRGQWVKGSGGICRGGERWQDGLTWGMVDADGFEKVISKTAKSLPEAMRFEFTPEIRARMKLLGNGSRIGPVIVSERYGLPYTRYSWSQAFRRIRDDLGLPDTLWMMDTRAGAVTEASSLGVAPMDLRNAAQHASITTTDRYARARSESVAKVVKLRSSAG